MNNLLQLFIRNGGFITFFVLEAISFYLIVGNNQRQGAIYAHSYGLFAGYVYRWRSNMQEYLHLRDEVEALRKENAELRTQNLNARLVTVPYRDTSYQLLYDTISRRDSLWHKFTRPAYEYVPAVVISNSIGLNNNWLMINRGSADGVVPNMGVVSKEGIVGIVRHVDREFSTVMSVLHRQTKISAILKGKGAFGSLVWDNRDPNHMTLKDIPRHIIVSDGDTVLTSGYSTMFPGGHLVGVVEGTPKPDRDNQYFYAIKVRLSQDPSLFSEGYVVCHLFQQTLDSLQQRNDEQR